MFDDFNALPLIDEDVEFLPIVSIEEDMDDLEPKKIGEVLPVLPLRNTVLFPGVVIPINVGREKSIKAVKAAHNGDKYIAVITQKDPNIDEPDSEDLNSIGTVARVVKLLRMPEGGITVIVQGRDRFLLNEMVKEEPYMKAKITIIQSEKINEKDKEFKAIVSSMKDLATQIIQLSPNIPAEAGIVLKNIDNPEFLIHFISSNLNVDLDIKQELLQINDVKARAARVLEMLDSELQMAELKNKIQSKVRNDMEKQQRDYFLHQQIKTIQEELGDDDALDDVGDFIKRSAKKKWSTNVQKVFDKEIKKLQRLNPAVPDYAMSINYIELLLDLPWNEFSNDKFDLKRAQNILDKDHYGLNKVKNRIIEHLAVLKLKGDMKAPILCFVGPPGVGKTSLGKSIAKALNRKYIRMSLGGISDESEIRGHRRTYIGAMPGRVIQSIKKVQTANPVFILDEIDKVSTNFRGDPSSALLEVLDPEQNTAFYDNYLEQEFDLSKVLFVATANSLQTIQPALRDRMEIITISGYSMEEKVEIAKKHLIAKQREANGLNGKHIRLKKEVLEKVIDDYTRESGVRDLERKIAALMRATAKKVALEEPYNVSLKVEDVPKILGLEVFDKADYQNDNPEGVVVGLAWTPTGGDILFIETILSKGKGLLTLTGNLGDVMKESATTALSYLKAHATSLGINEDLFASTNFHVHVPEGGIPKDGPSAGIAMLTALTSAITKQKVKPFLAMTGEITLRGKVLPVGGIKEKILAAKRAGIKIIIISEQNKGQVEEVNPMYIKGLTFHYVKNMKEVLKLALVNN